MVDFFMTFTHGFYSWHTLRQSWLAGESTSNRNRWLSRLYPSINLHLSWVFMDIPWFSHDFHGFSWVFWNMFPGFFDDSPKVTSSCRAVELSRYGSLWEMGAATELCLHLLSWWGRGWSRNDWVQYSNRFLCIWMIFWGVPEMGVPLNHPLIDGFSIINQQFLGSPIYRTPHMFFPDGYGFWMLFMMVIKIYQMLSIKKNLKLGLMNIGASAGSSDCLRRWGEKQRHCRKTLRSAIMQVWVSDTYSMLCVFPYEHGP